MTSSNGIRTFQHLWEVGLYLQAPLLLFFPDQASLRSLGCKGRPGLWTTPETREICLALLPKGWDQRFATVHQPITASLVPSTYKSCPSRKWQTAVAGAKAPCWWCTPLAQTKARALSPAPRRAEWAMPVLGRGRQEHQSSPAT